jgi:hypothetical protein
MRVQYVPMRSRPEELRGVAEARLRQRLERQGWNVWRGSLINLYLDENTYANVRRRYRVLAQLLVQDFPAHYDHLRYICAVHHGLPDFVCCRQTSDGREWLFVECKLMHEQLSKRQVKCITKLLDMGFRVEVHKLVDERTNTRTADIDLLSGMRRVGERQLRLTKRLCKAKTFYPPTGTSDHAAEGVGGDEGVHRP